MFENFPFQVESIKTKKKSSPLEMEKFQTLCRPFKICDSV